VGVFGVLPIPPEFVRRQIEVVLDDIGADAIKTGMLHDLAVIETIAAALHKRAGGIPLVVDPVMVAKGGARLIDPAAIDGLKQLLIARAEMLIGNLAEMRAAGESLLALGCRSVLVKGGHLSGKTVSDVLVAATAARVWESTRLETRHTHGTGCTFASAIAAGLAQGLGVEAAVDRARAYVQRAIAGAPGLGRGHGPLDHAHPLRSKESSL
jgi:hydroxymethylpyrimidine/phosphomethylpyrimidine kinase